MQRLFEGKKTSFTVADLNMKSIQLRAWETNERYSTARSLFF